MKKLDVFKLGDTLEDKISAKVKEIGGLYPSHKSAITLGYQMAITDVLELIDKEA